MLNDFHGVVVYMYVVRCCFVDLLASYRPDLWCCFGVFMEVALVLAIAEGFSDTGDTVKGESLWFGCHAVEMAMEDRFDLD